ncbi:hypothetical protein CC86DRAFT_366777 [Ophiobolus disseminans]|uniref:Uncharacterized protein n=1 Tax=Ophiobolus disseminans TaxID=1469910 RepID=A0A6A7ADM9_9PLEO|nr:hypothetical protein CC86DRAFT_366777 [Ophiobolus disseminans]
MKTSSLAAAATLLSASSAALVLLETTKCLDDSYPYGKRFDITMNLSGPVARDDLTQICGLRIVSATAGVDVNSIKCQAFKDVVGTQPGSAIFTYTEPALIATNPRLIRAVGCTYPAVAHAVKRQDNGTASASSSSSSLSSSESASSSTVTLTASSDASTSSIGPSTITSTVLVTPSSGIPGSSANATTTTLSTTPRPSASQTTGPATQSSGAASSVGESVGMGMGFIAVVAAMFV